MKLFPLRADRSSTPVAPTPLPLGATRLALGVLCFVLAGVLLAALAPAVAVVAAWPFLFLVPGLVLVTRALPELGGPGRLGVGVVGSVYLAAHVTNVTGVAVGRFERDVVLAATALLAALSVLLAWAPVRGLAPLNRDSLRFDVSATRGAWVVAGLAVLVVGGVLGLSGWHLTADGWVSGGWNWSDFLVHVAIASSILHGNFPPEVPYFAGEPLIYHWFADFHAAVAAAAAQLDVIPVLLGTSALVAGVFGLLVWELARRITGDTRVATLAALLAVFGGGMGYLRLGLDLANGAGDLVTLVSTRPYDNTWEDTWPWFRVSSVLGTGFLTHRATALGLPGLVAVVLLTYVSLGRRPAGMALAGLLAALLAPFQFFAFPAVYLLVLLLVLARRVWREPTWRRDALLFLAPLLLAAPWIAAAVVQQTNVGALRLVPGWSEARWQQGPLGVSFFYVTNLGVPFALAVVAALRRDLPARAFLVAWVAALFLVPNVIVVSAVEFDMNKYFQILWVAVAVMAAWLVRTWRRPALAIVLVLSTLSPLLVSAWHVADTRVAMSTAQERAARWIERNVPERAVFVTDDFINSPVDLAGRLRLSTFGPYVANLGYDPEERAAAVRRVYCAGGQDAASIMRRYGAEYVLSSGGVPDCGGQPAHEFRNDPLFETLYDVDGVAVWVLRPTA